MRLKVLLIYSIRIYNPKKLDNSTNKREWDTILAGMENNIKLNSKWLRSWRLYVVYILIGLFILALHSQCAPLPPSSLSLSLFFATHFARGVPVGYPAVAAIQCGCAPPPFALLLSLFICHLTAMRQFVVPARRHHTTPYNTIRYDTIRRFRFRFPVKFDMNI